MAKYTFFTQAARDGSNVAASSEELVNCYPEVAPGDGRTKIAVRSVLGEQQFSITQAAPIRAAAFIMGSLYVVSGATLYKVAASGVSTALGTVAGGPDVSIRGNGDYVTIAANGVYYVWNGTTLLQPTGGRIINAGSVEFTDYDTIITEANGRVFEWAATADPTSRNALHFASAEAREGNILRAIADRAQLFLFCEQSIEIWRNTGASGAQRSSRYQRLSVLDQGLKSYQLIVRGDIGVFFIGNDNVAYITSGSGLAPVSTPAVNTDLQESTPLSCGYYEDRGHKFCVIAFADRPAWVYDVSTQAWHRRQSGVIRGGWTARRLVEAFGMFCAIDDAGNVKKLVRSNADGSEPMLRIMRGKPIDLDGRKFSVAEFECLSSVGISDIGRDAMVMMRVSWDGGQTWGPELTESLGDLGQYATQTRFTALGRGEVFTPEISVSDPADIVFYSDARIKIT